MMVVLFLVLLAQAGVAAGWPGALSPWFAAHDQALSLLQAAGAASLFGGIGFLVVGQLQLGASWRIGIEEKAAPGLVTSGVYRFCRNPIFFALLIIVAGYTLLLPTGLSIALLVGTFVGVSQQVRAEEAYLLRTYGESYRQYARRVGRFLPGIGKLP